MPVFPIHQHQGSNACHIMKDLRGRTKIMIIVFLGIKKFLKMCIPVTPFYNPRCSAENYPFPKFKMIYVELLQMQDFLWIRMNSIFGYPLNDLCVFATE